MQKVAIKLKRLYAKRDKKKKKNNKKKTLALSAFSAPCPIITISASYLLATNSKITVISTGKKVNLRRPDKSRLETLVKKGCYFICKKQDYTNRNCLYKKKIKQF